VRSLARPDLHVEPEETLLRVAWLYYKEGLTQGQIAAQLAISRATVGRLLERARQLGIVRIDIRTEQLTSRRISQEIAKSFGLREALVIPSAGGLASQPSQARINTELGRAAAQFLASRIPRDGLLAIGWGDTVSKMLAAVDLSGVGPIRICTLTGGVNSYVEQFLRGAGGLRPTDPRTEIRLIPAPIVASTPELAQAFRADPAIDSVFDEIPRADVTVVGVGTPTPDATIVDSGYTTAEEMETYVKAGAVGDILGEFIDARGQVVDLEIHRRRIGIEIETLRDHRQVVGVAGGTSKADAILAALRGGYFDVLITTEDVASVLLARG
jgi:lsr operon transcriptional repressor